MNRSGFDEACWSCNHGLSTGPRTRPRTVKVVDSQGWRVLSDASWKYGLYSFVAGSDTSVAYTVMISFVFSWTIANKERIKCALALAWILVLG